MNETPAISRRVAWKLVALGLAVLTVQAMLAGLRPDWRRYPRLMRPLEQALEAGATVLYMGDSVIGATEDAPSSADLAQLLSARLGTRVARFDYPSYHAEVFAAALDYIGQLPRKPDVVIVPINLRMFGPLASLKPAYQFEAQRLSLRFKSFRMAARLFPILTSSEYSTLTLAEYLAHPLRGSPPVLPKVGDYLQPDGAFMKPGISRAERLAADYAIPILPDNFRLVALVKMAREHRSTLRIVFYLTPVDVETVQKELGADGRARVIANAAIITDALGSEGAVVLNLLNFLRSDEFYYGRYVNEHLAIAGRQRLALRLARAIANPAVASGRLKDPRQ